VLGDMAELGDKASYYHEQVGEYAKSKGITSIYSIGALSHYASEVFNENGFHFDNKESLVSMLNENLFSEQRDISILVKGSRSSKMELVAKAIEESPVGKFERRRERIAC
jgi:UDP-N-acetylmuramoyl-tripeptide--D-alanyl-D-alanine ligase